ncbi:MAG: type IV toxin-antitoxin system AbiEi family antitoxin domain-containing protein [Microthrixaceae bacterium]
MHGSLGVLADLAARQHGVATFAQAAALGVNRRVLQRAIVAGVIEQLHPQVVRFAAVPNSHLQAVHAAVLQVPGSVASHQSALALHRVDRVPFAESVTVPPGSANHHRGIAVHRFGDLLPSHHDLVDGIPCTTAARTVVDMSSEFSRTRMGELIDQLTITRRATTIAAIGRVAREVHHQGRRRIGTLGQLLDLRRPKDPAPRSRLERRADLLLGRTSLPEPLREYPLPADDLHGFVDRAWEDAKLILEIDGRAWHAREQAMARDRARDRAAGRAGWHTARVLDEELDGATGDLVVADLEMIYRTRLAQLHPSPTRRPA